MNEILKKRIEEAANKKYPYSSFAYYIGFIRGAHYALSHQWISIEEALPEKNEEVLCMLKSNHAIVSGYIFIENGVAKVSTNTDFVFERYVDYEVIAWMPIPKFGEKEDN